MSAEKLRVVAIGVEAFDQALQDTGTPFVRLDWKPPASGDTDLVGALFEIDTACIDENGQSLVDKANRAVFDRILKGQPTLRRVLPAHQCIEGMTRTTILHAGPPIEWRDMCGPMKGAFLGAIRYEGLAGTDEEAAEMMASGKITYGPNHARNAVGPMTGMISYSMPVFVVENETFGNKAYCTINEGIGKVMRFGANGPEVIERLRWLEKEVAPTLDEAVRSMGGVNLKNIIAQSLAMGDEMHQRNVAASLNFYKAIAGPLHDALKGRENGTKVAAFVGSGNEQFFLNLAMAASKAIMDPCRDVPHSTVITAMSRNGVNFGITVSGLGQQWFQAPCLKPEALYFPGFSERDANPDMGDSAIVECIGIGGFAMGSAPAVVRFVGAGGLADAQRYTNSMGEITVGQNPALAMPNMDFAGVPTAIDIRKVVATGILPVINTGVAHREPGIGQVGAGIVNPPMTIMEDAVRAFAEKYAK
ncbi:MAG: DUF1116 domain-containing protein [Planctomycetota bacterium]|jgi:hypothetical protein|nr:DUF1116 domain-containing protein [Planctomycetota bacterium]